MKRLFVVLALVALVAGFAAAGGQSETAAAEGPVTLSHFIPMSDRAAASIKSYDEMYLYQELERLFNIDMTFLHPPLGQEEEQFNLMVAAGDLPDIISWGFIDMPGGPGKAISDGTVMILDEYYEAGQMPHLAAMYEEYPMARKMAVTDDGTHYMFPFMRPAINLRINGGPAIRNDWLEKVGMDLPTNIEEWYAALRAFKTQDVNGNGDPNDEIPLFSQGPESIEMIFPVAWKVRQDFMIDPATDKIVFGPIQPGYRDYLEEMAKWYAEGLIDPDYITNDRKARDAKMTGDRSGAIFAWMNGVLGKFNTLMKDHPTFDLRGVRWPEAADGKSYTNNTTWKRWVSGGGTAISPENDHVDISLEVLDYAYSEEGNILYNFGEEGKTYVMQNGEPQFTDYILNNPEGKAATIALAPFAQASTGIEVGFAQDPRYASQIRSSIPQQAAAEQEWANSTDDLIPPPLSPPVEQSARLTRIMSEVNTYVDEFSSKVILGLETIDNFPVFVETLEGMGIDDATLIMQETYESFQKR